MKMKPVFSALAAAMLLAAPVPAAEQLRQDLPAIDSMLHARAQGKGTVYLRRSGNQRYQLVQLGIGTMSRFSMSVTACPRVDVQQREHESRALFLDGVYSEEYDLFHRCYLPLETVLSAFDESFCRAQGMEQGWHLAEIGYFLVQDLDHPWRWAAGFERSTGAGQVERKHFAHDGRVWRPMEVAPQFFFADLLH